MGIRRNAEKSKLLIPPHAPDPINEPRGEGNIVLKPIRSGIVSAGIPVGTDSFRIQEVRNRINVVCKSRAEDCASLRHRHPQIALRMLTDCTNVGMDYVAKALPPRLARHLYCDFDAIIDETRQLILGSNGSARVSAERQQRADTLARLPTRHGGIGQTALVSKGALTFLAAVLQASHQDLVFRELRGAIRQDVEDAYNQLKAILGFDDKAFPPDHPILKYLPSDPRHIVEGPFATNLIKRKKTLSCKRRFPIL